MAAIANWWCQLFTFSECAHVTNTDLRLLTVLGASYLLAMLSIGIVMLTLIRVCTQIAH